MLDAGFEEFAFPKIELLGVSFRPLAPRPGGCPGTDSQRRRCVPSTRGQPR